jgi:putative ABC transport system permease protein
VIRTSADPAGLAAAIRAAARDVDPSLMPYNVRTMDELRAASVTPRIFLMALILGFGALAFALAAVGVYGVVSLVVAERTREMGIRLALGASPRGLVTLIVKQAFLLTVTGVIAGVLLAIVLSPLVASQLFGVNGSDPATIAIVVAALLTTALLAAAIPAARVLRVDPIKTLRCD